MLNSTTDILSYAKKLKNDGEFEKATQILDEIGDITELTNNNQYELHYLKSILLFEQGYFENALNYAELALKYSRKLNDNISVIDALIIKTSILTLTLNYKEALKVINKAESILNSIDLIAPNSFKEKLGYILCKKGDIYWGKGEITLSFNYAKEGLHVGNELKNKKLLALFYELLGKNVSLKGDFDKAINYHKKCLELAEEINDKQQIICALNNIGLNFREKGEFEQAIKMLNQSIVLCEEINSYKTPAVLETMIRLAIEMKTPEKAKEWFEQFENFSRLRDYNVIYGYNAFLTTKAMVLKNSQSFADKIQAKEILKEVLKDENIFFQVFFDATFLLCDLMLDEAKKTNNIEILTELQPLISRISDIAKIEKSYWLMVEICIFQAKLRLITFEFKQAQKLLIQAMHIAQNYGQNLLLKRIMNEQNEMSRNFIKWERLKASGAKISERMDLTHLDEQIALLLQKRRYLKSISDQE